MPARPASFATPPTLSLSGIPTVVAKKFWYWKVIGGVSQIMITASYRFGPVSMLAPFDYASMLFAVLIGWVLFSEIPTPAILIGAGLVIAGGAAIIWRERQLGLDRSKSKASSTPQGTPS